MNRYRKRKCENNHGLTELVRGQSKTFINSILVIKMLNIFLYIIFFLQSPCWNVVHCWRLWNQGIGEGWYFCTSALNYTPSSYLKWYSRLCRSYVCVCKARRLYLFSCAFWAFWSLCTMTVAQKPKKCKSLRIRSDMFTLLFQLEGWSYQRTSICAFAIPTTPLPPPARFLRKST